MSILEGKGLPNNRKGSPLQRSDKKSFFKPIKKNAIIICPKGPNWERMKSLRKAVARHGHVPQLARLGLDCHSQELGDPLTQPPEL